MIFKNPLNDLNKNKYFKPTLKLDQGGNHP